MMQSVQDMVAESLRRKGTGWVFSKTDFAGLGSDGAIRLALVRLEQLGMIRRVLRGLYDYPRFSQFMGQRMGPDLDEVAQAIARKYGWRIQPSENTALNLLGLSTQVPTQAVYRSDGPPKAYDVGGRSLVFKRRALKESGFRFRESEQVVQALKALGQARVDAGVHKRLGSAIPASMWPKIVRDTKTAPGWIRDIIRNIQKEVF
jgi:hypothetical protein